MNNKDGLTLLRKYRNCLMGFAALWIFIYHEWILVFNIPEVRSVEYFLKRFGYAGVDIFFFLSGVGLFFSMQSHSIPQFYYRRIRRIVIPFVTMGLVYVLRGEWTVKHMLRAISGYSFYTKSIYSLLWFIPAIATVYLLFPLYYKLFSSSRNKTIFTLSVITVWLTASLALKHTMREDFYLFTNRIPVFCAGCLCGHLSKEKKAIRGRDQWVLFILTLILGFYMCYRIKYKNMTLLVPSPSCLIPNFLIATSLSFLLPKAWETLNTVPVLKHVNKLFCRFLAFIGTFSLEFYCVQEKLCLILKPMLPSAWGAIQKNIVYFVCSLAAGWILFLLQKTIWKLVDRIFSRHANPSQAAQ